MSNAKDSKQKNPNVPTLRFSDFSDSYRKIRIGQCLKIKNGQDQKSVSCENGRYFIYGTGGIIGTTDSFLYDKESVGIGRKGTIDKPFFFDSPFWTVDTLFYSIVFDGFQPKYIYYLFQTINWKKYNSSTGVPSLTSSAIESIEVHVPFLEEQQKIANMLTLLDKRIEIQNKIIEEKKRLLKQLNDWLYERANKSTFRFKDIVFNYNGLNGKSSEDFGKGFPFITYLNILNNRIVDENDFALVEIGDGEHQNTIEYGDVLLTLSSETPEEVGIASVYLGKNSPIYLNSFSLGLRLKTHGIIEPKYAPWLFSTRAFRKHIFPFAQGSTRYNLNVSSFLKSRFEIPDAEEQKMFLKSIWSLSRDIKCNTALLASYEAMKQYLLSSLFI